MPDIYPELNSENNLTVVNGKMKTTNAGEVFFFVSFSFGGGGRGWYHCLHVLSNDENLRASTKQQNGNLACRS